MRSSPRKRKSKAAAISAATPVKTPSRPGRKTSTKTTTAMPPTPSDDEPEISKYILVKPKVTN